MVSHNYKIDMVWDLVFIILRPFLQITNGDKLILITKKL